METRVNFLKKCSRVLGWIVFILPFLVLLGWQIDNTALKNLAISSVAMNPLTAVLFILSATSILFSSGSSRMYLIPVTVLILVTALYKIIQFKFDLSFKPDNFTFGNTISNPMAPAAAIGFVLINIPYVFDALKRKTAVQQGILLTVMAGGIFMIAGYLLDVPEFYSSIHFFPAFHTCLLFLLLAISILFSRPEEGVTKLLILDLEGSRVGRLLVPITIAIPIVIAYFRFLNERSGWVSTELGIALVLLSYLIILAASLFITISSLNTRDQARNDFIAKINNLNNELKEMHDWQLASNEELTASNEEIKSANEELSAINEQLTLATEKIRAQDLIIIEQKEEALKRSQQHLDIIFSNTREEILLMNPEGKLVIFNKALENFITHATGQKPRVGMYVWDMTVPSRREESKRLFKEALSGKTVTTEALVNTPTGEVTHFLKYEPVILDGKVSFVTLISVDITERKQAEDKLKKQFEELEKTNYELDHFVYSVSHDLRAPLSSILGLVNVAEMDKGDKLPFLGMIKGRVNHLDGFIKDILDYSHNARVEFQNKKVDFSDLLVEVKYNLKLIDGFDRLKIKVELNEQIPFYSDYHRLAIIFNNIVSNAIKFQDYSKQDPTLTLSITSTEDRAEIIATDNGIGIAADQINKIFDMFYRATERSKGSGLGLYIVKETISKLHGTINVKSKLGEYTSFEITIPNSQ